MRLRTSVFIFILLLSAYGRAYAQQSAPKLNPDGTPVVPLFCGVSVSTDLVGVGMKLMDADFAQMEVAARVSLKDKYMPIIELGYGTSDYTGEETGNTFRTSAPYFRLGMDYNFTKRKLTGNRLYGGIRYAFSSFRYDIESEGFGDPVWGVSKPLLLEDLDGRMHWAEFVFGMEARIWKIFRLGWNVRYKARISQSHDNIGEPWYVPGFGKNDTSCLGGGFNVIFEL